MILHHSLGIWPPMEKSEFAEESKSGSTLGKILTVLMKPAEGNSAHL